MKVEQECQQRKSQQTQPEPGKINGEGSLTGVLKVKSQKGKTVEIMQVEVDKPVEKKSDESRRRDESEKRDEPTEKKRLKMKVTHHPLNLKTKCMNSCRRQR